MKMETTRRRFLRTMGHMGLGTYAGIALLPGLKPVSARDADLSPSAVTFSPEIEPLVRLLEETPRANLMEVVVARIQRGLPYQQLLSALLLAGVRNVQPRPHVGFKFHAVLVVNSAHLASRASADSDRWLPILWAVDYFKRAQEEDIEEGNWTMASVNEARLPRSSQARRTFVAAMDAWDEEAVWNVHDAALQGSSYYDLPQPLRWLTANIGVHHVHHLYSRIPYYRLQQVLRDHPELRDVKRITIGESIACYRLKLWDERQRKLVSFKDANDPR